MFLNAGTLLSQLLAEEVQVARYPPPSLLGPLCSLTCRFAFLFANKMLQLVLGLFLPTLGSRLREDNQGNEPQQAT